MLLSWWHSVTQLMWVRLVIGNQSQSIKTIKQATQSFIRKLLNKTVSSHTFNIVLLCFEIGYMLPGLPCLLCRICSRWLYATCFLHNPSMPFLSHYRRAHAWQALLAYCFLPNQFCNATSFKNNTSISIQQHLARIRYVNQHTLLNGVNFTSV